MRSWMLASSVPSPPFYPSLPATDLLGLGLISTPSTAAPPVCSNHVTDTTHIFQVVSRLHALAAAYRAVNDLLENRLRSRNVHSEIVFSLSPNNNVSHPHTFLIHTKVLMTDSRILPALWNNTPKHKSPRHQGLYLIFTNHSNGRPSSPRKGSRGGASSI
jgi:hypothetical protein